MPRVKTPRDEAQNALGDGGMTIARRYPTIQYASAQVVIDTIILMRIVL